MFLIEQNSAKETEPTLHQGVVAVFYYQGHPYGIPLQGEDQTKFEVAIFNQDEVQTSHYDYLKDNKVGLIGGQVEVGEDLITALKRELLSELMEVTTFTQNKVRQLITELEINTPQKIHGLTVYQALQPNEQKSATPRGKFEIHLTKIKLSKPVFELLKEHLVPLEKNQTDQLRPLVAALVKNKNL